MESQQAVAEQENMGATQSGERPVLVTTSHRGVFFGYTDQPSNGSITLKRARMCVYWSQKMRGVLGLASQGPDKDCRVGDAVDQIELSGVTAVVQCTPQAVERWEKGPWS